ncbi:MAG: type II toxin-antitoxin system VapC family toxin [Prochlorococcaceae cyanobacterium]
MYLVDTNVISEARKGRRANPGVQAFFSEASEQNLLLFLSAITIGELRRGVDLIRHRGDRDQADALENWLALLLQDYGDRVLPLDSEAAQLWGHLRVPNPQHALDKQIAAIALLHDLTVVTRNTADFSPTGVRVNNPFLP